jgi:hypothetical protein
VHVLGIWAAGAMAIPDQRPDEDPLDEDEDRGSGPNQNFEKEINVPIEIRSLMEDRIGMILAARGE